MLSGPHNHTKIDPNNAVILVQSYLKRIIALKQVLHMKQEKEVKGQIYALIFNAFSKVLKHKRANLLSLLTTHAEQAITDEEYPEVLCEDEDHPAVLRKDSIVKNGDAKGKTARLGAVKKTIETITNRIKGKRRADVIKEMKLYSLASNNKGIILRFAKLIKRKILVSGWNAILIKGECEKRRNEGVERVIKWTLRKIKAIYSLFVLKAKAGTKMQAKLKGILKSKAIVNKVQKKRVIFSAAASPREQGGKETSEEEPPSIHLVRGFMQEKLKMDKLVEKDFGAAMRIQQTYKGYKFKQYVNKQKNFVDDSYVQVNPNLCSKKSGCNIV